MSVENCVRHQEAHEAFNRRDMEACLAYATEDSVFHDQGRSISHRGKAAVAEWLQSWVDMLDGKITDARYLDAGDYSICMFTGEGMGPKGAVSGPQCEVVHWVEGKVESAYLYYDQLSMLTQMGIMEAPAVATN